MTTYTVKTANASIEKAIKGLALGDTAIHAATVHCFGVIVDVERNNGNATPLKTLIEKLVALAEKGGAGSIVAKRYVAAIRIATSKVFSIGDEGKQAVAIGITPNGVNTRVAVKALVADNERIRTQFETFIAEGFTMSKAAKQKQALTQEEIDAKRIKALKSAVEKLAGEEYQNQECQGHALGHYLSGLVSQPNLWAAFAKWFDSVNSNDTDEEQGDEEQGEESLAA